MALNVLKIPLLLASASPRRHYLLREAGFSVRVIKPDVDEIYPDQLALACIPQYLSQLKAESVVERRNSGEVIIAADCIVVVEGVVLGKPTDKQEAIDMLRDLSGKTHQVYSGFTLKTAHGEKTHGCSSEVRFGVITNEEIEYYIDHYQPYDKAGAYGIQEWLGWCKIRSIRGSYSNIMGLPMELVYEHLHEWIPEIIRT